MKRIPASDSFTGLIAVLSDKLRERHPRDEIGLSYGCLCEGIAMLKIIGGYRENFAFDFDHVADSWFSHALEQTLFQVVYWGGAAESRYGVYMTENQSRNRKKAVEEEYGLEGVKKIEEMADKFEQYFKDKSEKGITLRSLIEEKSSKDK